MNRRRFLQAVGVGASAGVAGCGAGDATTEATSAREPLQVRMTQEANDFFYDPVGLYVEPGETVTWTKGNGAHSSTAFHKGNTKASVTLIPQDAEPWNSGSLYDPEASFTHTFEVQGTYDYFCVNHLSYGMVGRIVVGEPGGPAVGRMPPRGAVPSSETIVEEGVVRYEDF